MLSALELAAQRRQTVAFIAANATAITLSRQVVTPDGAGGKTSTSVGLDPQVVRVIEAASAATRFTSDGTSQPTSHNIVARWNADIAVHDTFGWDNQVLRVTAVMSESQYELRAECQRVA